MEDARDNGGTTTTVRGGSVTAGIGCEGLRIRQTGWLVYAQCNGSGLHGDASNERHMLAFLTCALAVIGKDVSRSAYGRF